jgi:predicted Ser/Thr protein kinase
MTLPQVGERFTLREALGSGSLGSVYAAWDTETRSEIALKVLPAPDPAVAEHLKHEFRLVRELHHPNLVTQYELFVTADHALLSMELIHGRPFHEALSAARSEQRTTSLIRQLVEGVQAIHAAGVVHCDLKPENVLVDPQDRVVVLDFNLALWARQTDYAAFGGTVGYMAPEAFYRPLSPASDWFAVGAMVIEALTGKLPWTANAMGWRLPPDLAGALGIAAPLAEAITAMVHPDPARRGDGDDVLAALGVQGHRSRGAQKLLGRDQELAALEARATALTALDGVVLSGPSGVGKSTVLTGLVDRLAARSDLLVLRARCEHAEHVPRRAFDALLASLVDDLRAGRAPLPPADDLAAIARLLPAFASLGVPAGPAGPDSRDVAVRALRRLLLAITTAGRALVLILDDVQWGDDDSADLIDAVLPPESHALLILSTRAEAAEGSFLTRLRAARPTLFSSLPLGPLPFAAALELARDAGAGDNAHQLAQLAAGAPILIRQLARRGATHVQDPIAQVRAALAALPPDQRRLGEVIALTDDGMPRSVAALAAQAGPSPIRAMSDLLRGGFLQVLPDAHRLAPYHDLVRQAWRSGISDERRPALHAQIADAYTAIGGAEPEDLFPHLLGANRLEAAADAASLAADRAAARVAWEAEARWMEQVAKLRHDAAQVEALQRAAEAWRRARRGIPAAEAFQRAADAALRAGRPQHEVTTLLGAAAEERVRHGEPEAGRALFERLLAEVGVRIPASKGAAMGQGLWHRFAAFALPKWLQTRRVADHARLELLWQASNSLSGSDLQTGFALTGLYVREAVQSPSPYHRQRALGTEATFEAALGVPWLAARADRLVAEVDAIAAEQGDAEARGAAQAYRTVVSWHAGRWDEAVTAGDRFLHILTHELPGHGWDMLMLGAYTFSARFFAGRFAELREMVPRELHAARALEAWTAELHLALGEPGVVYLLEDRPAVARQALERAWARHKPQASIETFFGTTLEARTALYEGRADEALRVLRGRWSLMDEGQIFAVRLPRDAIHHLLAVAALTLWSQEGPSPALAKAVDEALRAFRRSKAPMSTAMAAHVQRERERRLGKAWRGPDVAVAYRTAGMDGFAWAVERSPGACRPGVAAPDRFARLLHPAGVQPNP